MHSASGAEGRGQSEAERYNVDRRKKFIVNYYTLLGPAVSLTRNFLHSGLVMNQIHPIYIRENDTTKSAMVLHYIVQSHHLI